MAKEKSRKRKLQNSSTSRKISNDSESAKLEEPEDNFIKTEFLEPSDETPINVKLEVDCEETVLQKYYPSCSNLNSVQKSVSGESIIKDEIKSEKNEDMETGSKTDTEDEIKSEGNEKMSGDSETERSEGDKEERFFQADCNNLPEVDIFLIMEFMVENKESIAMDDLKIPKPERKGYGDDAIGFVELKRDGDVCTIRAKVTPEHCPNSAYKCNVEFNERAEKILKVSCVECGADKICKHCIALLLWLHRRNEEPERPHYESYYKQSVFSGLARRHVDDRAPKYLDIIKPYKPKSENKDIVAETPDESHMDETSAPDLNHKEVKIVLESPGSTEESFSAETSIKNVGYCASTNSSDNGDFIRPDYVCADSLSKEIIMKIIKNNSSNNMTRKSSLRKKIKKSLDDNIEKLPSCNRKTIKNNSCHRKNIEVPISYEEKYSKIQERDETPQTITKRKIANRTWNRRNACLYCGSLVTNFTRHITRHHSKKKEVIEYLSVRDSDIKIRKQKRQAITNSLRNRGNFLYNSKVCEIGGQILPQRRTEKGNVSTTSYVVCKTCLGTYRRPTFYKHFKSCNKNPVLLNLSRNRVLVTETFQVTRESSMGSEDLTDKILSKLRNDKISLVIKQDPLILAFGTRLLKKDKKIRKLKTICSKLRDLAKLLLLMQKKDPNIKHLKDVIDPEKYDEFIAAVKEMCGFSECTGYVKVTSIPARVRPAIIGCVDILYTQSLIDPNTSTVYQEHTKNKLEKFKLLLESNWQWEISSNAEKLRKRKTITTDLVLPFNEDIDTVIEKNHELDKEYFENLKLDLSALHYENLS